MQRAKDISLAGVFVSFVAIEWRVKSRGCVAPPYVLAFFKNAPSCRFYSHLMRQRRQYCSTFLAVKVYCYLNTWVVLTNHSSPMKHGLKLTVNDCNNCDFCMVVYHFQEESGLQIFSEIDASHLWNPFQFYWNRPESSLNKQKVNTFSVGKYRFEMTLLGFWAISCRFRQNSFTQETCKNYCPISKNQKP